MGTDPEMLQFGTKRFAAADECSHKFDIGYGPRGRGTATLDHGLPGSRPSRSRRARPSFVRAWPRRRRTRRRSTPWRPASTSSARALRARQPPRRHARPRRLPRDRGRRATPGTPGVEIRLREARATLAGAQRRLAFQLRALYEQGDVDPLAVVFGATPSGVACRSSTTSTGAPPQSTAIVAATRAAERRLAPHAAKLASDAQRLARSLVSARAAEQSLASTAPASRRTSPLSAPAADDSGTAFERAVRDGEVADDRATRRPAAIERRPEDVGKRDVLHPQGNDGERPPGRAGHRRGRPRPSSRSARGSTSPATARASPPIRAAGSRARSSISGTRRTRECAKWGRRTVTITIY